MLPCPLPGGPELGQTKLNFSGHFIPRKPGKPATPRTNIPLKRSNADRPNNRPDVRHWLFGESSHEAHLARDFLACRIAFYDEEDSDPEGHVLHRNSYPRELKLSAVE